MHMHTIAAIIGDVRTSMMEEVNFNKEAEHIQEVRVSCALNVAFVLCLRHACKPTYKRCAWIAL